MNNKKITNSRRQFLRNITLGTLSFQLLPAISNARGISGSPGKNNCSPTTRDYYGQGPFYTANAPEIINNILINNDTPGTRLILSGRVYTPDCTKVIPNTVLDIWHANNQGQYDNSGYNFRGKIKTNEQGFYWFETILPGKYLNGTQYRPSHIHFKITSPGNSEVITQLYFEGDEDISRDAAASITSGVYNATNRIIPLTLNNHGKYEGTWDISIDGEGTSVGATDIHLNKGIIYKVSPNPFTHHVEIDYGVFYSAKVDIKIYNSNGKLVAILDEQFLQPQKYKATWIPEQNLASGMYFVSLTLNDLPVHYLKAVKN